MLGLPKTPSPGMEALFIPTVLTSVSWRAAMTCANFGLQCLQGCETLLAMPLCQTQG